MSTTTPRVPYRRITKADAKQVVIRYRLGGAKAAVVWYLKQKPFRSFSWNQNLERIECNCLSCAADQTKWQTNHERIFESMLTRIPTLKKSFRMSATTNVQNVK